MSPSIQAMTPNVLYIVTRASKDGTFQVGDHIKLLDDGSILCKDARGWIDACDAEAATEGMDFKIDTEALLKLKDKLLGKIRSLDKLTIISEED
jgi:hypothetical protein